MAAGGQFEPTSADENLMEVFHKMQERRSAEAGPERINDTTVEVTGGPAPEQAPSWWQGVWSSIERRLHTQTSQMERMFGLQAERMNTLEARLEQETRKSREALNSMPDQQRGEEARQGHGAH